MTNSVGRVSVIDQNMSDTALFYLLTTEQNSAMTEKVTEAELIVPNRRVKK
jgi:hypothetical protein